jgi:hypothetical protein
LTLGHVGGAAGERVEPMREPVTDRLQRQHSHPRGGELDGERNPVEPLRDIDDDLQILARRRERRLDETSAIEEELDRRRCGERRGIRAPGGHVERRDGEHLLAGDTKRRPAGREDPKVRGDLEELTNEPSRPRDLLQVVEEEQDLPFPHPVAHDVHR